MADRHSGILTTSAKPIACGQENWLISTARHVLLSRSQTLFPPSGSLSKRHNAVDPGRHSFDFGLAFPSVDQKDLFCSKCESELPPNFSFATEGIKAAVYYQIRVVVERDGFLKPKITQEQPVQYKPLLPFFYSTAQTEWNAIGRIDVPILYPDGKGTGADESLLHQASVVTLEVKLPGPKILRPGNLANVTICLIIPPELRHFFTPTWIFGISIRLKARTVVTAATHIRAHIGYIDVCNVQAILPVQMTSDESCMTLPSALWEHCIYPAAIPTFQFCDAERTYQLAVTVDFACSKATKHLKATTLIDVKLESGIIDASEPPPEYNSNAT